MEGLKSAERRESKILAPAEERTLHLRFCFEGGQVKSGTVVAKRKGGRLKKGKSDGR